MKVQKLYLLLQLVLLSSIPGYRTVNSQHHGQIFADEVNLRMVGELPGFPHHYLLERTVLDRTEQQGGQDTSLTNLLVSDNRVKWAEQQFEKVRVKRGVYLPYYIFSETSGLRSIEKSIPAELLELWREEENYNKPELPKQKKELFNDELWDHQWYLHDTRSQAGLPDISLHVVGAWSRGIDGTGVNVIVLDDGLDYTHPDLAGNYNPQLSYDFNDNDPDPKPKSETASHGTRCAGEIAMLPNNHLCGVGVAFNSTIGGIRLLDGKISDELEGKALSWALDKVDIFSSSWGPNDDGATVEGPGRLATKALERGIREGRGGKGVIYVWASGNGGSHGDDCNCDGYTASIYTLSVSSASQQGSATWYGESCSSTLTSAFSSGAYTDQKIATTDLGGGCTVSHTGTSAAAPLAAGIFALVLQVAPTLTWRDVQYLAVYTSDPTTLMENTGWRKNGVGLLFNPSFGFGVLNADEIVSAAEDWENVPPGDSCEIHPGAENTNLQGGPGDVIILRFNASNCSINYAEHVQAFVSITHPNRGNLDIVLRSPMRTATRLLAPRPKDKSDRGFHDWGLMSVETWGEAPQGEWMLYISDRSSGSDLNWKVESSKLVIHGIKTLQNKNIRILRNITKMLV
ncbi:neuroendocrine convertase 1 isoform X2 [Eurytemora carolleeae]|uniref:neuroendocrine convertase 1 isoform X2 n=1 Tax=Eurytemora carolleeae TaxID=1294199 RepID=UPI000C778D9C|nr:neuroendocrine convertase 1 isoform X2 [Eurytemora carolleeae]|eukprot:XP_023333546.1 neuroendocrine convertase 1-like isoform X2 [Eurytemora affinis]